MTNEISLVPNKEEFDIIQMMAKTASESKHFERMGGFPGIFSLALYAREMGIGPLTALHGGLQNIMGKVTMSSEMMNSLIRQKGHKLEILECTPTLCRIKGTRKDTGENYTATFSLEDARRAGLVKGGGGYEKHPEDMLFARCISKLRRRLFPDVASRAYVHGEIPDEEEPKTLETAEIVVAEEKNMTVLQAQEILYHINGDLTYLQKILAHYEVGNLTDIPEREHELILERAKTFSDKKPKIEKLAEAHK